MLSTLDFGGVSRATALPTPISATEAATKGYVDGLVGGAVGSGLLTFGAFPGETPASLVVAGQTGILSGSVVLAWVAARATAQHTADEHILSLLNVTAGNVVVGVGFTIYASFSGVERPYGNYSIDWKWQ